VSAGESGGGCQEVPISGDSVSDGWGDASIPVGESGGEVCGGSGCAVTSVSGDWAVEVRAGSWEGVIVFSEDGDSTWGNTGSAGRPAGLEEAARGRSSPLAATSTSFGPWATGSRKAASTTSLAHPSMAVSSVAPEVSIWAGADDRVGVGMSSSVCSAVCSSSPDSQTGMIGLSALWVLKSAIG
jgi:hypothetical protein